MGAFTSTELEKYQANYSTAKTRPGYTQIGRGSKGPCVMKVAKRDNAGTWLIRGFDSAVPTPRIGHCTIPIPEYNGAVVCYGTATDGSLLCDFWFLSLTLNKWSQKMVDSFSATQRTGARGVLAGDEIWIFGGSNESGFLDDLHVVNMQDGSVKKPVTSGTAPSPRSNHVMAYHDGKILIYGGYDGTVLNDLYILGLEHMAWEQIFINHGRASAAYTMVGPELYVYGASSTPGFFKFDFKNDADIVTTSGVVPHSTITNASLVTVDKYLVLIGGDMKEDEDERPFAPLYIYDTESNHWSLLPAQPDGETTSTKDGEIDKNGYFRLPLVSQCSSVYDSNRREICVFLGAPAYNPPIEFVITMSIPLAAFHIQADMVSAFRMGVNN